jgi:hypothetical protein
MVDLAAIIKRFPDQELAIRRTAANAPQFAETCDEYAVAAGALERWKNDAVRAEEYRALVHELEEDIQQTLAAQLQAPPKKSGGY